MVDKFYSQERTLVIIKPDAVKRGLIGEVLSRIERKGLRFVRLEFKRISFDLAEQHYAEHKGKPFYSALLDFITSGDLVVGVVTGVQAVAALRQLAGATDPVANALPGSIRGDFALNVQQNIIHSSDSVVTAAREIALWFPELAVQS